MSVNPDAEGLRIGRLAALAGMLEPLSEKTGCTTRAFDRTPHSRLEHFQIASVNILIPIAQLHTSARLDPECVPYEYALLAMDWSLKNRPVAKINFGIIHLLIPLVVANARGVAAVNDYKDATSSYLSTRSSKDVVAYEKFIRLFFQLTPSADPRIFDGFCPLDANYQSIREVAIAALRRQAGNPHIQKELGHGFPLVRRGAELFRNSGSIHHAACQYFDELKRQYRCRSVGTRADIIAAALFLYLCEFPDVELQFEEARANET